MRITPIVALFTSFMTVGLRAQSPPAPATIEERLDTPQARVLVFTLRPRMPAAPPVAPTRNRLIIYMDDGVMTRTQDGQSARLEFRRGDIRWSEARGTFVVENISEHPIRLLEIELKGPPKGPLPHTELDPAKVDPRHYTVAFENDQVRVLRVHYGPHEKGATHQHMLNRVVFYLSGQGARKADDINLSGPATHVEANESDQPADRIAVELK